MSESNELNAKILRQNPSASTLFLLLSEMKEKGMHKRVIQECLKALNVYHDDLDLRRLLAECYYAEGLVHQAGEELKRVTSQIDLLASAFKLKGEVFIKQNRENEAIEALKCYLAHKPDDLEIQATLNKLEGIEGELPAGAPELAVEEGPREIATPTLAEVYFDQGQIQEAIDTYEKVLRIKPEDEYLKARLEELKNMIEVQPDSEAPLEDPLKAKKQRLVGILEMWRNNIRKISENSAPA